MTNSQGTLAASDDVLGELRQAATGGRPRVFALSGFYDTGAPLLGWGMDFGDERGAWFCEPNASVMVSSMSAETVAAGYGRAATVLVIWLDEQPSAA
jgi:hypothetical protein